MLPRIEYFVVVPVSPEAAFRAFCDLGRLLQSGIYEEAAWVEGKPWQVGSRVRYVVTTPLRTEISAVVTSVVPPHSVGLLNHAIGVTADQYVTFEPDARGGGTQVRMIMEFVGKSPELPDDIVHQAITLYTHDALDTMAALCQQRGASSSSGA